MNKFTDIKAGMRFPYYMREILNPANWWREYKYDRQRKKRGWSDKDTWGGGEYIAGVTEGILRFLDRKQNPIDWEFYFRANYKEIEKYGYTSLTEIADDIELYLWWEVHQYDDEYDNISHEDKWAIDMQLYSQLQNAMHFIAENIGMIWW